MLNVTPGAADADAFATVEQVTDYAEAHGLADWTGAERSPPEPDEAAIRRATAWLSAGFAWKGTRLNGREQALGWPRAGVTDADGQEVDAETIPAEIVQACCIAAAFERANPGGLAPVVDLTARVRSETIGPISTSYETAPLDPALSRPVLLQVRDLVAGLAKPETAPLVGRRERS